MPRKPTAAADVIAQADLIDALRRHLWSSCESAAIILGVSPSTIRREIRAGRLAAVKVGRQFRIKTATLESGPTAALPTLRRVGGVA